jgi:Uma2 family endonuclease
MAAEAPAKLVTAEEFLHWPDDGQVQELVEGVVVTMPPPKKLHGLIVNMIAWLLTNWARATKLADVFGGDTGYVLRRDPDTVRGADVSVVLRKADQLTDLSGYGEGAPDLAVEVLSPSNRPGEVLRKVGEYLDAGGRMVWVVDPERRAVTVFRSINLVRVLHEADTLDGEDVLPGFSCRVAEIFQDLP